MKLINYRFAGSQTVLYVTLENHAVRFGESESFIYRLQSITVGSETGENGRVDGASENLDIRSVSFTPNTNGKY